MPIHQYSNIGVACLSLVFFYCSILIVIVHTRQFDFYSCILLTGFLIAAVSLKAANVYVLPFS